ncbi:hypothetical protein THRCLA_08032 [Thraustotheca clavata]|uniref:Little elongation complex subunit 2 C-terminal domain-containing protein n=1 Tax=Thraustotheca clavata TaxID=74557 RepID=A0A1V9ZAS0_9STRA|nr:hypothetical protein THRCLA_08032 [Thraustotheca clavata]
MNIPLPTSSKNWLTEEAYDYYSMHGSIFGPLPPSILPKESKNDSVQKLLIAQQSCFDDCMHARKTTLLNTQHATYLELFQKKANALQRGFPDILALSEDERRVWDSLQAKVAIEQNEFRKHFNNMVKKDFAVLTALPEHIEKSVDEYLRQCCSQAKLLYPQNYDAVSTIPLAITDSINTPKHVARVGTRNSTPTLMQPLPAPRTNITKDIKWQSGTVLSKDSEALRLMNELRCDISLAASTLSTLFNHSNGKFREEFNIPVAIVQDANKKMAILDKPLVDAVWSARKKLTKYTRKLLKSEISELPEQHVYEYHTWQFGAKQVLLRIQPHAYDQKTKKTVNIHTKIDYEWCTTPESTTESERTQMWLHSWIRGNASIVLGRFNGSGSQLIQLNQESLSSITSNRENPLTKFTLVQDILNHVCELPLGQYIVSYTFAQPEIRVYSHTPEATALNLHERLDSAGRWDRTKLDINLPEWPFPDQIPYTFLQHSYCKNYFESNGTCPRIAQGRRCGLVHLKPNKRKANQYIIQSVVGTQFKKEQPGRKPKFQFCKLALEDRCFQKDCALEHMNLHEFMCRFAREYAETNMSKHDKGTKRKATEP